MFGIGGLNDPGQDGSPIRHTALHRPMEELRRVPVGSEGHAAQRSEHQNPPLLSTLRSSVNSIRQDMAFDDQVSRPARLLHQSEEAAQRNVHDDAHTRFHPGTGSNLSPRLRPASVAQHPMPAWNSQALPISELPQPVSYDDRQRSINQSPDHARRQLFEENRALRERDCGPGRPASPPYARFDRQHREWLSDRGPFVTNSNLANAHESGNNSQTLSPYPRQDRSIQTGAQREPRKQSNILSILNAEPDEPSSRAPPPRTHTPPYRHDSMPDHSRPVSHTVRHDRAGHQNADLHGSVSTNVDMGSSFAPKPSQAFTTGTDSSSRLISGDGRPRQPFEYPGRSSSADLHYQVARNSQTRTPPGVLGFGSGVGNNFAESSSLKPHARAIERPHSGMHAERASERQAYVPEPGNGMYQERHPSISFNASRDTRGLRGHDLSKGPSSTAMRSADDFLLNGSGTYRGRSAQFDRHLSQRQAPPPLPPAEYRTSDPKSDSGGSQTNPFMHPESRAPLQRHFPEQYRPPSTTFGGQYPSEPRSIMGFGRIGPAQQQSAGMPQSQDNEPSKTRPP